MKVPRSGSESHYVAPGRIREGDGVIIENAGAYGARDPTPSPLTPAELESLRQGEQEAASYNDVRFGLRPRQ